MDNAESSKNLKKRPPTCFISSTSSETHIPLDFFRIWSKLPKHIKTDASLDVFHKDYENILKSSDAISTMTRNCSFINISMNTNCEIENELENKKSNIRTSILFFMRYIKLALFIFWWISFSVLLMITNEKKENSYFISLPDVQDMTIADHMCSHKINVAVASSLFAESSTIDKSQPYLSIWLSRDRSNLNNIDVENASEKWILPLMPYSHINSIPIQRKEKTFELARLSKKSQNCSIIISLQSTSNRSIPISLSYNLTPIDVNDGLVLGTMILIGLYISVLFDLAHRTISTVLAATSSLAVLAILSQKPTILQVTSWIDFDTIMLLFSMMVLVAIIADTGIFDYFTVFAYKITRGKIMPLVTILCFFTAFVSAFLDNVTVIMLILPVTIRLCEVISLDPVPVIIFIVMFSNVGGAMTPVGDPPNVIVSSNRHVIAAGVNFGTFTLHMGIGVLLALIILYGHFRFTFRNVENLRLGKTKNYKKIRQDIEKWKIDITTLTYYNGSNNAARDVLLQKVREVLHELENTTNYVKGDYETTVKELSEKYYIKDKWLLIKSGISLTLVIILFFLHSLPNFHLSIGSTAFLCVLLLLILADDKSFDDILTHVEWSTLLFFAALFIFMEALTELGLISWIGDKMESIIMSVSEESRLAVTVLLLLWVSAFASAIVDNVPLTTMMIRIVTSLTENRRLKLPLQPLVWALAFGACLGGNGTLMGATTNVVCAGIAEQHGYRVSFLQFFKMGFPVLLSSTITISIYLMVAHAIYQWNY